MADETDKVYATGLTLAEARELQKYLWEGTKFFAAISAAAHFLVFTSTPWLH